MGLVREIRGGLSALALVGAVAILVSNKDIGLPGQELLSSLRMHLSAALLLLPLLFFVVGAWWRGVAMLALIAISFVPPVQIILAQQATREPLLAKSVAGSFDMLSFNVLASNETPERVSQLIVDRQPDVALIMEAPGLESQLLAIRADYPYQLGCETSARCDSMLLSRTPLTGGRVIGLAPFGRDRLLMATTELGGQSVTVVGLHLSKPYFDQAMLGELWQAYRELRKVEGPLVLAGDFNSSAWSEWIAEFVDNANLVAPPGYPGTWPTEAGPLGVPIDNMFSRGGVLIRSLEALRDPRGSNHLGLWAELDLVGS